MKLELKKKGLAQIGLVFGQHPYQRSHPQNLHNHNHCFSFETLSASVKNKKLNKHKLNYPFSFINFPF